MFRKAVGPPTAETATPAAVGINVKMLPAVSVKIVLEDTPAETLRALSVPVTATPFMATKMLFPATAVGVVFTP
jgi:hypothetical protein